MSLDLILVRTAFDKVNALLYAYDQSMINKHLIEQQNYSMPPQSGTDKAKPLKESTLN